MIRRSPAEFYLKFLLVHPDGYTDDQIRTLVVAQQLDFIGMPYLRRLRSVCVPPTPFYPETNRHRPSRQFLRAEKLESIFDASNEDMKQATEMLHRPKAKEILETMLVSNSEGLWISAMLRHNGFEMSEEAVRLYRHYYFNVGLVDITELRVLMQGRGVADGGTKDEDEKKYGTLMVKAINADPRRTAAQMSSTTMAQMMTTLRMGIMPSSVEVSRLATAGRFAALAQANENLDRGFADKSRDFALTAKLMSEILDHVGDASADLQKDLATIRLDTEEDEVPHINQLSDGNHTTDIAPIDTEGEEVVRGK